MKNYHIPPRIKPDPTALTAKQLGKMSLEDCLAYWKERDPGLYAACIRVKDLPVKKFTKVVKNFMDISSGADQ